MDHLSKNQESFCETAGIFGVLISLTCLVQHIIFMIPHWITYSVIIVYLLSITGFTLLAKKSSVAFWFISASTILVLVVEAFMILTLTFSLVLLMLLIYSVLMAILIRILGIQDQLKLKEKNEKEEKEKWDKIYQ